MSSIDIVFLASILITAVVSTVASFRFPEGKYNLYIETLLYFVTYTISLLVFPHYFYYTYMFAIMFVIVIYFNKKFLIVMSILTEVVNIFIVSNYKVELPFPEYHGYIIAMILIMFLSFYTGLNLVVKFMKENQDAIMETSNKNEEIAKRVVNAVASINQQFDTIMDELDEINKRSETSNVAMRTIAESTERPRLNRFRKNLQTYQAVFKLNKIKK